jgi:hypothetical protein
LYDAVRSEREERTYWAPGAIGNDYQTDNVRGRRINYPWYSNLEFSYFDYEVNTLRSPEHTHLKGPIIYRNNTIREYNEHGLKYVYHIYGDHPSCRISSVDFRRNIEIYDARTVMKFIELRNEEVRIANLHKENNKR